VVVISLVVPTTELSSNLIDLLEDLSSCGYFDRNDIEVIIVENSKQSCKDLNDKVTGYGAKYTFQPVSGQAAALNKGISEASGEYIAFTDDDVRIQNRRWLDQLKEAFEKYPDLGYASGNIKAFSMSTPVQKMWENKGGLSKGNSSNYYTEEFFHQKRWKGLPLRFIAAGANSMIPKNVLKEVGNYNELFGCGSPVGHSQSHEICYKVLQKGYSSYYDANAIVLHNHPETEKELLKKMYDYGIGDTAIQLHFFWEYRDWGGLSEALLGRHLYLWKNLLKRTMGKYPLPAKYIVAGMLGAALGPFVYLKSRIIYGNGKNN